jgi:hypothetical protein
MPLHRTRTSSSRGRRCGSPSRRIDALRHRSGESPLNSVLGWVSFAAARAWVLIGLLFFATDLSFLDRQAPGVLAPRITAEFGMTNTAYSRVVFAFVLTHTVTFPAGDGRWMPHRRALAIGSGITKESEFGPFVRCYGCAFRQAEPEF